MAKRIGQKPLKTESDVVIYIVLKQGFEVRYVVRNVEKGEKPDNVILRLKNAGKPLEVKGSLASDPVAFGYFKASPREYKFEKYIAEDKPIILDWKELKQKDDEDTEKE